MRGLLPYRGVDGAWFGPQDAVDGEPWRQRAACRSEPPDLFFPEGHRRQREAANALGVCQGCEVRVECLAYAQANGETWGVWGGVDFEEPWRGLLQEKARRLKERRRQERGEAA